MHYRYLIEPVLKATDQKKYTIYTGKDGTYLEVGAFKPQLDSNTYLLEVKNNWRGLSVELKQSLKQEWKACNERSNPIYFSDALSFDYKKYLIHCV